MSSQVSSPESEKGREPAATVELTFSILSSQQGLALRACEREGTCCCTKTIEDEDQAGKSASQRECCCNDSSSSGSDSGTSSLSDTSTKSSSPLQSFEKLSPQSTSPVHPSEAVFTGRPQTRRLIRRFLEQALGESAVVICGPQGLMDSVRKSVVALSDERAAHKGTGAQGVYLHIEGFEY